MSGSLQPRLDAGTMAVTPGLVNASVDEFDIAMQGRVGHAGYPHTVVDPVLGLAATIVNLQQIPARRVDPVVSFPELIPSRCRKHAAKPSDSA